MINRTNDKKLSLIAIAIGFLAVQPVHAQLIIYPMKGQSSDQLSKDRYECHVWAVQQSGFDPTNAQVNQQPQYQAQTQTQTSQTQPGGQVLRGGVRGAAMGAAVGAIAGDAGKGASIGAAAGGIRGGFRHLDQKNSTSSATTAPPPQTNQTPPGQDVYNQAIKACLTGRNYSVN